MSRVESSKTQQSGFLHSNWNKFGLLSGITTGVGLLSGGEEGVRVVLGNLLSGNFTHPFDYLGSAPVFCAGVDSQPSICAPIPELAPHYALNALQIGGDVGLVIGGAMLAVVALHHIASRPSVQKLFKRKLS